MKPRGISGIGSTYSLDADLNKNFRPGKIFAETIQEMLTTDAIIKQGIDYYHNVIVGTRFYFECENQEVRTFFENQFFHNPNFTWTGFIDKFFTSSLTL
jgi:hypothetical protein